MLNLLYLQQFFKFNLKFFIMDEVFVILCVPKSYCDYSAYLSQLLLPDGSSVMGAFSNLDSCVRYKSDWELLLPDTYKLIVKHLHVII